MVGIVLVSHSRKIVEGIRELAAQMAKDAPVALAGGTEDDRLGTDMNKISNAVHDVYSEDGVLVFFDMGSAYMNAQMALDFLEEDGSKVEIVDAAFVEGAITAIVDSGLNKSMDEIKADIASMKLGKMP
ncbi:dihydroxyacetone kinase phosphoryl donor subunit DhaM [Sporolactobacillus shoreicorticis]|uniref:phosphoenolpyruvate--glycerone phosphotransferase n=1 Tax=Sporolactobacillus shoreicorticis TaxID=1923877 RepID=A0ABW5S1W0_9BACL|nr:dihydroxyacetone kinase phosphoryl donor subunit DhaM [Sporolactobacillus shoreicorticis]MCO7124515.1 dihydroxyacetone kinase phosphoryl donor subunit DhaM [Sporolactobacillus shoreicorticis]